MRRISLALALVLVGSLAAPSRSAPLRPTSTRTRSGASTSASTSSSSATSASFTGPDHTITFQVPVRLKSLPPEAQTLEVNCRPGQVGNGAWSEPVPIVNGAYTGTVSIPFKVPQTAKNSDYTSYTCLLRIDTKDTAIAMGWVAFPTAAGTTPVATVTGTIPQPK